MDNELKNRLDVLEGKIDLISKYIKFLRNVFLWTLIITIAVTVLPLIAMLFVLPSFMSSFDVSSYTQLLGM
jgi:ABC-type lipoprotein release transport system permease subunit